MTTFVSEMVKVTHNKLLQINHYYNIEFYYGQSMNQVSLIFVLFSHFLTSVRKIFLLTSEKSAND